MIQQYDHRAAHAQRPSISTGIRGRAHQITTDDKADPNYSPSTRYLVPFDEVLKRSKGHTWFIGYREISGAVANIRSMVAAAIPRTGVNHKILLLAPANQAHRTIAPGLLASLNSFVFDYILRQKMTGTSISFYIIKQIPVLPPSVYLKECPWDNLSLSDWLSSRVLELTYTSWDMEVFAKDLGHSGSPFRWDGHRRLMLRCELDSAFFLLYGIERNDTDHIMESFDIVRRKEERAHGEYISKRLVLEIYDKMKTAIAAGTSYRTILEPPPADPRVAHRSR